LQIEQAYLRAKRRVDGGDDYIAVTRTWGTWAIRWEEFIGYWLRG
jgi:hypothetical protein